MEENSETPLIMIIDDDANLRKTLADILRLKGHETMIAETGMEGLSLLQKHPVHLVLLDIGLPDISGIEVMRRIKADYPTTEVIILTGNADLGSAIAAANNGAFSYLLKPYDIEQLVINVQHALERRQVEEDRNQLIAELQAALAEVRLLEGIIPICMYCKKIRDDQESWQQLESYISYHSEALFSHGICPDCYKVVTDELAAEQAGKKKSVEKND